MATSLDLFSGFNRSSTVPAGNLAKASSVGAKTVKGPLPFRVSTRPAGWSAAARVLKEPAAMAVSTMSFLSGVGRAWAPRDRDKSRARVAAMEFAFRIFLKLAVIFFSLRFEWLFCSIQWEPRKQVLSG